MAGAGDPNGYYKALGISNNASASEIKSSYRKLAKELHPDLNQAVDTTSAFQYLQEAYHVLGDDGRRAQYDAFGAVSNSQKTNYDHDVSEIEPVKCSDCGRVTAQPRFKVFYFVVGYIIGAYKKPIQGIFCSNCEFKNAIIATIGTIVFGWWSVIGFFWTIHALFYNLIGGRFHTQNAFLQGRQAFYFAQSGNFELSSAVAQGAIGLIWQAKGSISNKGHEKDLASLQVALEGLVSSMPNSVRLRTLKKSSEFFNKRFVVQSTLFLALISIAGTLIFTSEQERQKQESERLQQQGIAQAQADAIAAQQEEALRAMKLPLPRSGVHHSFYGASQSDWPPFKINNAPGANALIKLIRVGDGKEVISVFVRADETVKVKVPQGTYTGKIASGQTWYGDQIRFGPNTNYGQFSSNFEFSVEANRLAGQEVTLTRVENGNLSQSPLDASQF